MTNYLSFRRKPESSVGTHGSRLAPGRRSLLRTLAIVALSIATISFAHAQAPTGKATRILVGFPPGQATDLVARIVAERLTQSMGHPVIVENKPGQGGSVALAMLAKSPADGSVLSLSALAAYVVNPYLYKNTGYETLKDLDPVGLVADLPLVLAVHPDVPASSLKELIAFAKTNPDKLAHSSSGNGTLSHLLMEDFKQRAGVKMLHVPYTGSARAMNDLVGGSVQVGLDTAAVIQPRSAAASCACWPSERRRGCRRSRKRRRSPSSVIRASRRSRGLACRRRAERRATCARRSPSSCRKSSSHPSSRRSCRRWVASRIRAASMTWPRS
jgi:tripartite-type tricarboxylate transporter receptor subunit TctC